MSYAARILLFLGLVAGVAAAHGGTFRPPPRGGPGDPFRPTGGGGPTTAPPSAASAPTAWEAWWHLNRDPYLRLRERMAERTVITGRPSGADLFDRTALRESTILPVMLAALGDEDAEVRGAAAIALGKFGALEAMPRMRELAESDDSRQVREAAVVGLMILRDPSLAGWFRERASDPEEKRRIRGFATLALGFLGDAEYLRSALAGKAKGSRPDQEEIAAVAALALGFTGAEGVVGPLATCAADGEAHHYARGYCGTSLSRIGNPVALPEMLKLLQDGDQHRSARQGAAIAAGGLIGPDEESLIALLGKKAQRDKDPGVRVLAIMALGRIGGEAAATQLVAGLHDCQPEERGFYHLALGISGVPDVGDILQRDFEEASSPNARASCALGLALAGHRAAAPLLRGRLERGNPGFVPHGMVALGLLDDRESIPLVQQQLRDTKHAGTRREGAIALALLRRTAAVPELVDMLREATTTTERGGMAAALGLVGDATAVPPLLAIFEDRTRQGEERAVALAALGRIGDPERIPFLSRVAVDLNPYVFSDAVVEILTIL